MRAEVSIQVIERGKKAPQYTLLGDVKGELTAAELLDFAKRALISVAREVLQEEQARGFDKNPITRVDNRIGKPIENVTPFGKIEFFSRKSSAEILIPIYEEILRRSRVDTGLYKRSNLVAFRGRIIAANMEELKEFIGKNSDFKEKDRFRFINITPYARRLEHLGISQGKAGVSSTARKGLSKSKGKASRGIKVSIPNGTYVLAYRSIRSKFKANAFLRLEFLPGDYLGIENYKLYNPKTGQEMHRTFSPKKKNGPPGRHYLYPTILVGIQEAGLLQ